MTVDANTMNETYKAFSLLTEKSFEDGDTVIRGFASTPTPDRVLDVVVPEGAVFRTQDIKLHMNHDTRQPVGNVKFGKPTRQGIPFEARLPDVKEAGIVMDRVNEARHSIKYNLISAVSIGFRALEDGIERLKSGGLKFTKWEMIELSLTSTPCNPEAVFAAVKALESGERLPEAIIQAITQGDAKARRDLRLTGIPLVQQRKSAPDKLEGGAVRLIR